MRTRAVSDPDPQDPKVGSFANFDSWGSKNPGLLDKRPSKRPKKELKNQVTGPNFENTESNHGSRFLILRIRYSSNENTKVGEPTLAHPSHANAVPLPYPALRKRITKS